MAEAFVGEAFFKAAASLLSLLIGAFVLAGSRKRAANVFLAAFMFLLAGNQFAETMRALADTVTEQTFWFRIASVFAFLDPLAFYYFGSVFPTRNRLNRGPYVAAVTVFCVGLAVSVPFLLHLGWRESAAAGTVMGMWVLGTVVIYGAVLFEAARNIHSRPRESRQASLIPALAVLTLPALFRASHFLWSIVETPGNNRLFMGVWVKTYVGIAVTGGAAGALAWVASSIPSEHARSRRLLAWGAGLGFCFALLDNPGIVVQVFRAVVGTEGLFALKQTLVGAGGAFKLLTFGILASGAILRTRMLDLSLRSRRWAARVLTASFALGGTALLVFLLTRASGFQSAADPAFLVLFLLLLVATSGFRRTVDVVAEKMYRVPREEERLAKLQAYQDAVQQAIEEDRAVGADPRLRRLRDELEIDEPTASVLERMTEKPRGGPLLPGEIVEGRYRVDTFLGRGATGRVFRARDELLERTVVLKEILDGGPHETARALKEARVAGRLNHPNVVTVHDILQRPGASLLVTEFVEEGSLADHLEDRGALSPTRALRLLDGILSGLEAVHDQDIVHGDLKPANVLLDGETIPKIADFGSSHLVEGETWSRNGLPGGGTPSYMPPELREGEPPIVRSDVFSAGILAREMMGDEVPERVQAVIDRATARRPRDRWGSATEFREALRKAISRIDPSPDSESERRT